MNVLKTAGALLLMAACAPLAPVPGQPAGGAPAAGARSAGVDSPGAVRVILFIGDGVGTSYWTVAQLASPGPLAVSGLPVVGLVETYNSLGRITDSAAGATAYAAGVKTFNSAIGVGPDSAHITTVLEIAERRGLATGLVATSTITHATPASFAAHVPNRRWEPEIARQMAAQGIDAIIGGGRGYFDGTMRPDSADLVTELMAGYTYVTEPEALRTMDADTVTALLGLLAADALPPAIERSYTLAEMTEAALVVLDRDADGFFLMVEGSQPDWRGHANTPIEAVAAEMLDFDAAIGAAIEYQRRHPETLIVVTADHETGGLAVEEDGNGAPVADYTTGSHTGAWVPLFAAGPGAERFAGILSNVRVGELIREFVERPIAAR